jgi:acetyltransferase-like isoleucine patch superfamily enzyme
VNAPVGADAVLPEPGDRLAGLRLARLRMAARGRLEVCGRVGVERGAKVAVARGGRVVLEDGCLLGAGCRIEATGGVVRLGAGARLGARAVVVARERVEIGPGSAIGEWALVCDTEPTYDDPERPTRLQPLRVAAVEIGDNARIGAHAAISAGATIPAGAVVGSYETRSSSASP